MIHHTEKLMYESILRLAASSINEIAGKWIVFVFPQIFPVGDPGEKNPAVSIKMKIIMIMIKERGRLL